MNTQTTQTTLELLDKAEYLGSSIRTNKSSVSRGLNAAFRGPDADAPRLDGDAAQEANLELLERATRDLHQAAQAHRVAKVEASGARLRRNRIAADLVARYRGLRKAFEGTYGRDALVLVGLEARPARAHLAVREQCRDVVARMRDAELSAKIGEPAFGQAPLDIERLAAGMAAELGVFEKAVAALTKARTVRDDAVITKRAAEKSLRKATTNVARIQEGYYRLAGLDELADRMRLTVPKSAPKSAPERESAPDGDLGDPPDAGVDADPVVEGEERGAAAASRGEETTSIAPLPPSGGTSRLSPSGGTDSDLTVDRGGLDRIRIVEGADASSRGAGDARCP